MVDTEMIAMQLIAGAGDAKGSAFDALNEASEGRFEEAQKLIKEASKATLPAHKMQMDLLVEQANGEKVPVDILMVHAQDHLMTSELAQDLIRELLSLYERVYALEQEVKQLKGEKE